MTNPIHNVNNQHNHHQTAILNIFDDNHLYEIRFRGTLILSIIQFNNNTGSHRSFAWADLTEKVREKVIKGVKKALTPEEE